VDIGKVRRSARPAASASDARTPFVRRSRSAFVSRAVLGRGDPASRHGALHPQ
jgi:hypothetical protein